MKRDHSLSSVMVSVSLFALAGLCASPVFAQVVVNCTRNLNIGKIVQCANTGKLIINPDSSTSLTAGCLYMASPPQVGRCNISTGGVPPTKSVAVTFSSPFLNIINGGKQVRIESLRMQYNPTVGAATKFTFPTTKVIQGINLKITGTVNVTTAPQGLGSYTGHITIRANPL